MTAIPLELKDTFGEWRVKINDLVTIINDSSNQIDNLTARTPFSIVSHAGLSVSILGGRVRDGSDIETLLDSSISLLASKTNIVAIYKRPRVPAELRVYDIALLPKEYVIPLYSVATSATVVTAVVDLRTSYNTASGSAGSASSILQFDKAIEADVLIPANRNGLSVGPEVNTGVVVEVSSGSTWVVL